MSIKTKTMTRERYMKAFFSNDEALEEFLGGIPIRTELTAEMANIEYLPVLEREFFIDVWDMQARLARRTHIENAVRISKLELKHDEAKTLFGRLVDLRDVIINRSGHYYIETKERQEILDNLLKIEGLREGDV